MVRNLETWRRTVEREMKEKGWTWGRLELVSADRHRWRALVEALCATWSTKRTRLIDRYGQSLQMDWDYNPTPHPLFYVSEWSSSRSWALKERRRGSGQRSKQDLLYLCSMPLVSTERSTAQTGYNVHFFMWSQNTVHENVYVCVCVFDFLIVCSFACLFLLGWSIFVCLEICWGRRGGWGRGGGGGEMNPTYLILFCKSCQDQGRSLQPDRQGRQHAQPHCTNWQWKPARVTAVQPPDLNSLFLPRSGWLFHCPACVSC